MNALLFSDNALVSSLLSRRIAAEDRFISIDTINYVELAENLIASKAYSLLMVDAATVGAVHLVRTAAAGGQTNSLVFGLSKNPGEVAKFAKAGAIGFALRETELSETSLMIEAVCKGESRCSEWVTTALLQHIARTQAPCETSGKMRFTDRETEIAQMLNAGHSNKEIARELSIELATAKNHVHSILRKLDVTSRAKAVVELRNLGHL